MNAVACQGGVSIANLTSRCGVGHQIRGVAVAPDGTVWLIEKAKEGLFRVTTK